MKLSLKTANLILSATMLSATLATPALAQESNQTKNFEQIYPEGTIGSQIKEISGDTVTFKDGTKLIEKENYIITKDENGKDEYKVTKVREGKVKYVNLQTGKVNYATINSEKYKESPSEQVKTDTIVNSSNKFDNNFTTYAAAAPPNGAVNGYTYSYTKNNSTDLQIAKASLVASIIALAIPGPGGAITGGITAAASYYASVHGKKAYWKERYYSKSLSSSKLVIKVQFNFYKYADYTGYISTTTKYQTCQPYGCGPLQ